MVLCHIKLTIQHLRPFMREKCLNHTNELLNVLKLLEQAQQTINSDLLYKVEIEMKTEVGGLLILNCSLLNDFNCIRNHV